MPSKLPDLALEERRKELWEIVVAEKCNDLSTRSPPRSREAALALDRLEHGQYGLCMDCGGRIPAARLKAKPEAVRCVACQAAFEKRPAA
jgi:RNA polymerase-binding transcription factor DksA